MNEIVRHINELLVSATGRFKATANGIAEPIIVRDEYEQVAPYVVDTTGECKVVFDDACKIGWYHRLNTEALTSETVKGYGDKRKTTCLHDMSLVVYGFRDIAEIDKIAHLFMRKLADCGAFAYAVNYNRQQVFGQEFSGVQFFLQPEHFLFKISYRVKTIEGDCFDEQIFKN